MAVIASTQVTKITSDGAGELITLLRINGVASADTIDVSTMAAASVAVYHKVKAAVFFAVGALATNAAAGVAGTVLTLTLASLSNDTVYLLVIGEV